MKKRRFRFRDPVIAAVIMGVCFGASVLMQNVVQIPEQVTTSFAFGVFLVSLLTDGYFWGLAASVFSLLLVNYAFTFPYFALNFEIPSNFFSAVVMAVISVMTSALTTKVKHQEAMKAETEKEKMRSNLLRAISHDLRTPLTAIYGSSELLLENGDSLTREQRDKILQGIQEDAQWLVTMVENLLSITRIDSAGVQITTIPTAVDELIDSVLQKFRKHHPQQKVEFQLPEETVIVSMDALLMEQVLMNLLENAVQHSAGMTRILLRVTVLEDRAVFEIMDDGCGIPKERLPYLFTGWFQPGEQPVDHAKRNAGIGLSVCATIVRAHGGAIEAENNPNGGATFRFILHREEMTDE